MRSPGSPDTCSLMFLCGDMPTSPTRKLWHKKIDAAADHDVGAFIFDWYYSTGRFSTQWSMMAFSKRKIITGPSSPLCGPITIGATFNDIIKGRRKVLYPNRVTPEAFDKICDQFINDYFLMPNYWRIDGKPYFSFRNPTIVPDIRSSMLSSTTRRKIFESLSKWRKSVCLRRRTVFSSAISTAGTNGPTAAKSSPTLFMAWVTSPA